MLLQLRLKPSALRWIFPSQPQSTWVGWGKEISTEAPTARAKIKLVFESAFAPYQE